MSMSTPSAYDNQRVITPQTTTILFDHDGTLIDSETIHFDLWCDILGDFDVTLTQDFYCKVMAGIPVKQNAVDLVEHFNLDVSPSYLVQRKHECLDSFLETHAFPLMPFAKETILACTKAGYTLGIVTGGSKKSVEKTLSQYGLRDDISCVVAVEDVARSKPAPDCYQLAMKMLGVSAQECIAVEDTQTGLAAAVAAGLRCVVIPNVLSEHHDFSQATAQCDSLSSWLKSEAI